MLMNLIGKIELFLKDWDLKIYVHDHVCLCCVRELSLSHTHTQYTHVHEYLEYKYYNQYFNRSLMYDKIRLLYFSILI